MKLNIKFTPKHFTAPNKRILMEHITAGYVPVANCKRGNGVINGYIRMTGDHVRVFNLHKHNRHGKGTYKAQSDTPMWWEAFVYDIPMNIIETCGFKVTQNCRNFTCIAHI